MLRLSSSSSLLLLLLLLLLPLLLLSILKKDKEESVKQVFKDTAINVTVQGQKHMGAVIGSREYLEEYASEKVTNWVGEVTKLAEFALSQPQACCAAYTFGLKHRWTYFLRTLSDIRFIGAAGERHI